MCVEPSSHLHILNQNIEDHVYFLDASDCCIIARMGSGAPQGGPKASEIFHGLYEKAFGDYNSDTCILNRGLVSKYFLDDKGINVATTFLC